MSQISVDAGMLKKYFLAGAKNLEANKAWIDELNVFPVPDGDTGTNMTMTLLSAVKEVQNCGKNDMAGICKAISKGSLRGARGNSGVIMSQLLRGFTRCAENYKVLGIAEITEATVRAVETAYKAVMKPKEGTILTVARGLSEKAVELSAKDIDAADYLGQVIAYGDEVLAKTPDMLPVLKEAGVVDAGGQGLILFLKGVHDCMLGKEIVIEESMSVPEVKKTSAQAMIAPEDIKFGYCTEFIINLSAPVPSRETAKLGDFLDSMGDSIVLVPDDEFIKIHVHTNEPGTVLQKALKYGELTRIKIDNMREEHREILGLGGEALMGQPDVVAPQSSEKKDETAREESVPEAGPEKDYGFIAVAAGDGFADLFNDLGADIIISGGQTMNPCTDDFLGAIKKINAKTIFIFPNNSNIIMAASQAAAMTDNKRIIVIPTKTVPQGLSCMVFFDPGMSPTDNEEAMKEAASAVKTASVTYAIRDTQIDGYDIHEGDIMAVGDHGIIAVGQDITTVAYDGAMKMIDDESGLVSIYYGEGYDQDKAEELAQKITDSGSYCDIEVHDGGQPVYYCIVSVE